jgi:hypothetical protein
VAVGSTAANAGLVEVSDNAATSFESVAVPAGTPPLQGVSCFDSTHCFAVGGSTILSSSDGGVTWAATSAGQNLTSVSCQSDTSCAAVGGGMAGTSFIYTTNGTSWFTSGTIPSGANAVSVACTASACVAVGVGVYASNDGGNTWQAESVIGGTQGLTGVSCLQNTTCLAVGQNIGPGAGLLVITADDGDTWTNEGSVMGLGTATAREVSCVGSSYCGVVGLPVQDQQTDQFGATPFVTTSSSGASWSSLSGPSGFRDPSFTTDVGCWSPGSCVIVGGTEILGVIQAEAQVTTNGGSTWTVSSLQ